ncbi:MAG: hypothetical protein CSB48_04645 [Proteobacteria bacterium]|nr:MAG: hypothetical protein CSB48_04645 [Pseudomonadota bacterium]
MSLYSVYNGAVRTYRFIFLLVALVALSACDSGESPARTWKYAAQGILGADLSPDGKNALIGSIHHGGSFWDVAKGERLFNWNHKKGDYSTIRAVAISGDGKTAITAEGNTLVVWNTRTGKPLAFWQTPDQVVLVRLSENGRFALMGLMNNTATYFDLALGGGVLTLDHDDRIRALGLTPDGKYAITGSGDFTAILWDLRSGKPVHRFIHDNQIGSVAISPDGKYAFSAAQRENAVIWNARTGKPRAELAYRNTNFTSARFSEKGNRLLLGTFQGKVYLIDVKSSKELKSWHATPRKIWGGASSKAILSVGFSGKGFYAISSDGMVARLQ